MKDKDGFVTVKAIIVKGAVGNTEWWTDEDWRKHNEYVEQLKKDGEYLKEEEVTFTMKPHPIFDAPNPNSRPVIATKMVFLNFNEEGEKKEDDVL